MTSSSDPGSSDPGSDSSLRGVARQIDRAAVAKGCLVALVLVAPAAALSIALIDTDAGNPGALGLLFFALVLLGFGLGGRSVARTGVDLPLTHGSFVGLVTFGFVQLVLLIGSAIVGREGQISVPSLAISAMLASSAGMIGAMLGRRSES